MTFRTLKYWGPAILYLALIFYMSSHPAPEAAKNMPMFYGMKLVHIIEYAVLSILFWWALIKTTRYSRVEVLFLSVILTILFGLTDEFHQVFVPGRSASLMDATTNGISAAAVQIGLFLKRGEKRI